MPTAISSTERKLDAAVGKPNRSAVIEWISGNLARAGHLRLHRTLLTRLAQPAMRVMAVPAQRATAVRN